jgi:hypothetical protein
MRARWKWIIGVGVVLAAIQIIRPERSNPPVVTTETIHSKLTVEPAVSSTFAQSCNDCRSNLTVWPWYSNIAPASWLVVSDVGRGPGRAQLFRVGNLFAQKAAGMAERDLQRGIRPGNARISVHLVASVGETNKRRYKDSLYLDAIVQSEPAD